MFNKRRQLKLPVSGRPSLHQVGDSNVFVLGSEKETKSPLDVLERMFNEKANSGAISLESTKPRREGHERRNPERRIKIDRILQTSTIPLASKKNIINLLKIINRSLGTKAERDVALRVIKTFLGE